MDLSTQIALYFLILATLCRAQQVAIIGGGISGSFTARYLAEYDKECKIKNITIFEAGIVDRPIFSTDLTDAEFQGSRVSCFQLKDGRTIELGASIGYKGFHLVLEMIHGDEEIKIGEPFTTGKADESLPDGLGIYNGQGLWSLITSSVPKLLRKFQIAGRYGMDLIRVSKASQAAQEKFARLPALLKSNHPDTFYQSPEEVWQAVELDKVALASFDQLLDALGVGKDVSWLRSYLPYQGALRSELLEAMNLVNYNQGNDQVNGLVGLASFAVTAGGVFSIQGGNYKILQSAIRQAQEDRLRNCGVHHQFNVVNARVTTVVKETENFLLFAGEEMLGRFDDIVLATPLQLSKINFLVQSDMDSAVLRPMPLAGLVKVNDTPPEEGHMVLPGALPEPATRPYTPVVTTVVSNATLNTQYLALDSSSLPRSIMTTKQGKSVLHNITAITLIASDGVYKVFSGERLDGSVLKTLFGPHYVLELEKVWGGPYGGATPDYQGRGFSSNFLLYDSAVASDEASGPGAIYYPSIMEQMSLACMEISAIGARAVAKLLARRLGLITPKIDEIRDEL
jgi:prenylcysteine oxidase/farnesylcysteine lyase